MPPTIQTHPPVSQAQTLHTAHTSAISALNPGLALAFHSPTDYTCGVGPTLTCDYTRDVGLPWPSLEAEPIS